MHAITPLPPVVPEIEWGVWVGTDGDMFRPRWPQPTLCVHAEGPVLFRPQVRGEHPGYRFEPHGRIHCDQVSGGFDLAMQTAEDEARVLVARFPPRPLERPGATFLSDAGEAVLVPAASPDSVIQLQGNRAEHVSAYAWPSLRPLEVEAGVVRSDGGATVLLLMAEGEGTGVLRWSDPEWHDRAPRLGSVLGVAALALLVALYRGPRDWASSGGPVGRRA